MNKIFFSLLGMVYFSTSFYGCSTAVVRVLPGENGVHKVVTRDIEKEGAEKAGSDAAMEYCEKYKKQAVFMNDKTQYTGTMDESTRETVRRGGKAAQAAGFVLGGMKGKNDNTDVADIAQGTGAAAET